MFDAAFRQLAAGVAAAAEQEKINQRLAVSLANLKGGTTDTVASLEAFANQLEGVTGIGNEAIQELQNLLIALGGLRGEGLERATRAALDFSVATGRDLTLAANLVAKAAAGSTAELARYGLILPEGIKDSEKLATVLTLLEQRFGGAAAAVGQTFSGSIAIATEAFDDLRKQVGATIVESEGVSELARAAASIFDTLGESIKDSEFTSAINSMTLAIAELGLAMSRLAAPAADLLNFFAAAGKIDLAFKRLALSGPAAQVALSAFPEGLRETVAALAGGALALEEFAVAGVDAAGKAAEGVAGLESELEALRDRLKAIAAGEATKALEAVGKGAKDAGDAIAAIHPLIPAIDLGPFVAGIREMGRRLERIQATQGALAEFFPTEALDRFDVAIALFGDIGEASLKASQQLIEFEAASGRVLEINKKTGDVGFRAEGADVFAQAFERAVRFSADLDGTLLKINDRTGETIVLNDKWLASVGQEGILAAYDRILASTQGQVEATDEVIEAINKAVLTAQIQADVTRAVASTAADLGGALVDAFTDADASFADFAKAALKQLARMIVQAIIFRAIMASFGGGGGVGSLGGFVPGGFAGSSRTLELPTFEPSFQPATLPTGPDVSGNFQGSPTPISINTFGVSDGFIRQVVRGITDASRQHGVQVEIIS